MLGTRTGRWKGTTGCRATHGHPAGSSLLGVLPPISTNQPLSRGAPAPPLHQEVSGHAQERQQEARSDQSSQGLPRKVLVAPHAPLLKGFYSELEKHQREPRVSQTGNVCIWSTGTRPSNNAALHLPCKLHINRAGLHCPREELCTCAVSLRILSRRGCVGLLPSQHLLQHTVAFCRGQERSGPEI